MARRFRVRNFNINDEHERAECEEVMTKYGQGAMNSVMKHETHFDIKSGKYYVALHWYEDITEDEYRD